MTSINVARETGHCINCALTTFIQSFCSPPRPQLRLPTRFSSLSRGISFRSLSLGHQLDRKTSDDEAGHRSEDADGTIQPRSSYRRIQSGQDRATRRAGRHEPPQLSRANVLSVRRVRGGPRIGRSLEDRRANSVRSVLYTMEKDFRASGLYKDLDMTKVEFWNHYQDFRRDVDSLISPNRDRMSPFAPAMKSLAKEIAATYQQDDIQALAVPLKYAFYNMIMAQKFSPALVRSQEALADFRYPMEWYPQARLLQRTIHVHVGPTNSGKTHNALKRLEECETGCYASPLRLLAHEIYTRMNARGKPCRLVTGDDIKPPSAPETNAHALTSCTVEMVPLNVRLDVAVIDEVQMLSDDSRGHAWTAALIGLPAKEIHLCGEERAVPLIQDIAASLGEQVIIHRYNRLSPLKVMERPLGSLRNLEKGDCVVAFSVIGIHALRNRIEAETGRRVAVVYGSLPPETRAQQARLFNDPDNEYDFLVASDAVGMGLNLSIKRLIFDSVRKRDNNGAQSALSVSQVKQIAGRAGRYRTADQDRKAPHELSIPTKALPIFDDPNNLFPDPPPTPESENVGLVTTLNTHDLQYVRSCMDTTAEPLVSAGLFPPDDVIHRFCTYFPPGTPYSFIIIRLMDLAKVNPRFQLCGHQSVIELADVLHPIKNLSLNDRISICYAPVSQRNPEIIELIKEMATCIAEQRSGAVLELQSLNLDILDEEIVATREHLLKLETLHKGLVLYCWMSFRFPGVFIQRPLAIHAKSIVETSIDVCLGMWQSNNKFRKTPSLTLRKYASVPNFTRDTPCHVVAY